MKARKQHENGSKRREELKGVKWGGKEKMEERAKQP